MHTRKKPQNTWKVLGGKPEFNGSIIIANINRLNSWRKRSDCQPELGIKPRYVLFQPDIPKNKGVKG